MPLAILVIDDLTPIFERAYVVFPVALEVVVFDTGSPTESVTLRPNMLNVQVHDTNTAVDIPLLTSSQRTLSVFDTAGPPTEHVSLTISRALAVSVVDNTPGSDVALGGAVGTAAAAFNPTAIDPMDMQDRWGPTWLVDFRDIALAVLPPLSYEPRDYRLATLDVEVESPPYNARIVDPPSISRSLRNSFWGTVEIAEISFSIANADGFFTNALYTQDIRGRTFTVTRYDWITQTVVESLIVTVSQVRVDFDRISIKGFSPDLTIFEQKIPAAMVTAETFGTRIVDLGAVVPLIVGSVEKVPLPYIHDGVDNNTYDYVVGIGNLTVRQVYRDGLNGTMVEVKRPEYRVSYDLYPGFTVIRFLVRQVNFTNSFHKIFADVDGLQTERNFARFIQAILSNTTWGLSKVVDADSFDQAASDITNLGLLCDGALITQVQVQDVLNDLMVVRGMRLGYTANGAWSISVDKVKSSIRMQLSDGVGDGERNILSIQSRQRTAVQNAIANYILQYRQDFVENKFQFTQSRQVTPPLNGRPLGQDRTIQNIFIRDHVTADKVIDYLAKREIYGAETVNVTLTQEARGLLEGDIVQTTYLPMGFDHIDLEVRTVEREQETLGALLSGWSAAIYVYTPGRSRSIRFRRTRFCSSHALVGSSSWGRRITAAIRSRPSTRPPAASDSLAAVMVTPSPGATCASGGIRPSRFSLRDSTRTTSIRASRSSGTISSPSSGSSTSHECRSRSDRIRDDVGRRS